MPTLPARGSVASLWIILVVASAGACARTDAGEAEGTERPQAAAVAESPAAEPAQPAAVPDETRPRPTATSSTAPAAAGAPGSASGESQSEVAPALVVAEGTMMLFTVDQTISTEKQKVGDRFTASLAEPVLDESGAVILEAGTVGQWVVTESTAKNAEGQAVLAVALEMVDYGGDWRPVSATVTDLSLKTDNVDSKTETAAKIGIGAAAGALAGKILGGSTDATLKGAGAGAAIGTAVALATRGGSASIQRGSKITVTLNQKLELPPR